MSEGTARKVLWADDDYPSFPVVDRVLRQCGAATVHRVITLKEALDLLERNTYDLVIMDAILPQGGEQIGQERYGGAELYSASRDRGLNVIVLTLVPETELPFSGKERDYRYFPKSELGPRSVEFKNAVAAALESERREA